MTKNELYEELKKYGMSFPKKLPLMEAMHYAARIALFQKVTSRLEEDMRKGIKIAPHMMTLDYGPNSEFTIFVYIQQDPGYLQ